MENIHVDKFLISYMRSLEGTMKIFNVDNITSSETDNVLNKNITYTQKYKIYSTKNN